MILLAIFLPPLAVLLCGKPFQALLNCFLCLLLWIPGVIHAVIVVNNHNADKRNQALIAALQPSPVPPMAPLPIIEPRLCVSCRVPLSEGSTYCPACGAANPAIETTI